MNTAQPACHRVLVVEDEADQRKSLAMILESKGYDVDTAENGRVALEKMRARRPDAMLLDLFMPVMDGWQVWDVVSHDESLASIPVIVLSGVAESRAAQQIGAAALLRKPVDLKELYRVLEQQCSNADQQQVHRDGP